MASPQPARARVCGPHAETESFKAAAGHSHDSCIRIQDESVSGVIHSISKYRDSFPGLSQTKATNAPHGMKSSVNGS